MPNKQYLSFGFKIEEIKQVGDKGIIRGYASTFGNVDLGLDVVDPGAFAKTIKEQDGKFPILKAHNPQRQIGLNVEAREDSKGLFVVGELNLKIQDAVEEFALNKQALEHDKERGLSIGFMTIKAEPDSSNPAIRRLKELKLFEYSTVAFPMNEMATVTGAKGLNLEYGNLEAAIKFFIDRMAERGYSDQEIKTALATKQAALSGNDPEHLREVQSLLKQANIDYRETMNAS